MGDLHLGGSKVSLRAHAQRDGRILLIAEATGEVVHTFEDHAEGMQCLTSLATALTSPDARTRTRVERTSRAQTLQDDGDGRAYRVEDIRRVPAERSQGPLRTVPDGAAHDC